VCFFAKTHCLAKEQGRPTILPVRLAYREPFQYPLSAYLNHINYAFWQDDEDTPRLIGELRQAISGGELTIDEQSRPVLIQISEPLEIPGGAMDVRSKFYVERPCDRIALETIERQGTTITIEEPGQTGKSSLLRRITDAAEEADKQVAFLDFQQFGKSALADEDTFFRLFCTLVTDELEMDDRVDDYWQKSLTNPLRCTRYVSRYLLKELGCPLVVAMDKVKS